MECVEPGCTWNCPYTEPTGMTQSAPGRSGQMEIQVALPSCPDQLSPFWPSQASSKSVLGHYLVITSEIYPLVSAWRTYTSTRLGIDFSTHRKTLSYASKLRCYSTKRQAWAVERVPEDWSNKSCSGFENLNIKSPVRMAIVCYCLTMGFLPVFEYSSLRTISFWTRRGVLLTTLVKSAWSLCMSCRVL